MITDSDHLNRDAPESPPVEVKGSNGAGAPSSTSQVRLRPRENAAPFVLSFQRSGGGVGGGAAAGRAHLFWLNKRLVAAWCATSERVLQQSSASRSSRCHSLLVSGNEEGMTTVGPSKV